MSAPAPRSQPDSADDLGIETEIAVVSALTFTENEECKQKPLMSQMTNVLGLLHGERAKAAALKSRVEELTKALESARGEIVVAIAFIGRDLYSDRINDTADSLHTRLSKADADARRALAPSLEDR